MNIEEILKALNFSSMFWQILTPIIFSIADIITGFIQAVINKNIDSSKMRVGILHKLLLLILIILSFIIDVTFSIGYVSKLVCGYIVIMEVVSILENITKAGIDTGKISEILQIKRGDKNENEQGRSKEKSK